MIEEGQNEQEAAWREARVGHVTGSRIDDIVRRLKDKSYSKDREIYKNAKIMERLTNRAVEKTFFSEAMRWGIEQEANAIAEYRLYSPHDIKPAGKMFIKHPRIEWSGASPDAFVGEDGLLEVKCPETHTHLAFLETKEIPLQYMPQILWQLACTQRKWCDFMSYDPRCPDHLTQYIVRVDYSKSESAINRIEDEVRLFLDEVEFKVRKWRDWRP